MKRFAVLYLVCYIFLLRLPSEALPMVVAGGAAEEEQQSVICLNVVEQELVLKLRRCVFALGMTREIECFVVQAQEQACGKQIDA